MLHTIELTEIERNTAEQPVAFREWTERNTLVFSGSVGAYEVALDGSVTPLGDGPPAVRPREPTASADGAWRAMESSREALAVTNEDASVRYRLVSWDTNLDWAPRGHLAALGTGACRNGTLHVLDPDAGTLQELTTGDDHVLDWLWHPDGARIVANAVGAGLKLYRVADGTADVIVSLLGGGELTSLAWSADGRYLAFRWRGGRDFGCGEGASEPPYTPPRLERICDRGLC
jgi:hypothetical protein